jgi:hypothetical protein
MSGGGGGSYAGDDSGGKELDCNIVRRDSLTDPDPKVLKTLKKGDVCEVQLDESAGRARIVVVHKGAIVGILFFQGFTRMIECMRGGHDYIAIIQTLKGGWCEVEVRPAAPVS